MKLKNHKVSCLMMIAATAVIFSTRCDDNSEPDAPAIFSNVEKMTASYTSPNFSFSNVPDDCEHLVLGIFDAPIVVSDNVITNTINWKGGSKTGIGSFTRGGCSLADLREFDQVDNYNSVSYTPAGTHWAVWGYNSDWTLICATKDIPNSSW